MLKLSVVTPEGQALQQEVDEVTVPGVVGEFGVLPGHVALLAATRAGVLRYRRAGERSRMAIAPGFAEVDGKDEVIVLAQRALPLEKLDRAAAERLLSDADARLQKLDKSPADAAGERAAAASDKAWAQAQLDTQKAAG